MRIITVEEHFVTPAFVAGPGKISTEFFRTSWPGGAVIVDKLSNVGDGRIAEMDAAGVDVQVLSLNSPGVEQAEPDDAVACAQWWKRLGLAAVETHPVLHVVREEEHGAIVGERRGASR